MILRMMIRENRLGYHRREYSRTWKFESKEKTAHAIPETIRPHGCCNVRRNCHQSTPHITNPSVGGT